jgi:hypothetical protein
MLYVFAVIFFLQHISKWPKINYINHWRDRCEKAIEHKFLNAVLKNCNITLRRRAVARKRFDPNFRMAVKEEDFNLGN